MISELKASLPSLSEALPSLKKKTATELAGPCPKCGGDDRFYVKVETGKFRCRQCGWSGDVIDYHCWRECKTIKELTDELGLKPTTPAGSGGKKSSGSTSSIGDNSKNATRIWENSTGDDQGIRKYFASRGIELDQIPSCIRLNRYKGKTQIVVRASKPGESETVSICRRELNENFAKNGKSKMLGPVGGRAAWLSDPQKKLVTGEGVETVLSVMTAMNLPSFAYLSAAYAGTVVIPDNVKEIIILVDSDPNYAGQEAAKNLATRFPGKAWFATPDDSCFTDSPRKLDFNDLNFEKIRERFEKLIDPSSIDSIAEKQAKEQATQTLLVQLAQLPAIEYDKVRIEAAKKMGVRVTILDSEVEKLQGQEDQQDSIFEVIEPWPDPVNGADLLNEIRSVVNDHLVIQTDVDVAVPLWVLLTYCYDSLRILPLLGVTSPEKRCGKTTFAEVLQGLVFNSVVASNISSAVLYRLIEKYKPTLMVDEADTFLVDNDELRGVFNSGHTRKSAFVWRVNTETLEPEKFSTWGPKAVLMIGGLPGTMDDRSIRVRMRRKAPDETVKKLTLDFDDNHLHIRRKCVRWAADNSLLGADPDIPNVGNDRASDNWLPLLAIADKAGGEWPNLARSAMLTLEHDEMNESDSAGQMLLTDIQKVFKHVGDKHISSEDLVFQLVKFADRPWCEWKRGKPITQNSLSRLLKPYGIRSKKIRFSEKTFRGYELEKFQDSFERYLPSGETHFQSGTVEHCNNTNKLHEKQSGTRSMNVPLQDYSNCKELLDCSTVPLQNRDMGEGGIKESNQYIEVEI